VKEQKDNISDIINIHELLVIVITVTNNVKV
jgi:hypothetical protein